MNDILLAAIAAICSLGAAGFAGFAALGDEARRGDRWRNAAALNALAALTLLARIHA